VDRSEAGAKRSGGGPAGQGALLPPALRVTETADDLSRAANEMTDTLLSIV